MNSNEKQEGLLKRLKNIEEKTDNQLDFIRDHENMHLDLIRKTNANKIKSIGFQNERPKMLEKEIKDKEQDIRKKVVLIKKKTQAIFLYTATDNVPFHFNSYTHLMRLAEEVYKKIYHLIKQNMNENKCLKH